MNSRDWFTLAVLALLVQCSMCKQLGDIGSELHELRTQLKGDKT